MNGELAIQISDLLVEAGFSWNLIVPGDQVRTNLSEDEVNLLLEMQAIVKDETTADVYLRTVYGLQCLKYAEDTRNFFEEV